MAATTIYLGSEERVNLLFSFPNVPTGSATLAATVLRWLTQTLNRDGLLGRGARASVRVEGPDYLPSYFLELTGPDELRADFAAYAVRIPQFLNNGWNALTTVIPPLKAAGKWDPSPDPEPPPYRPWRFFLPLGTPMIHQRSLQFFHYPPIRLLEGTQDYLYDPVPFRWQELLEANGVANDQEAWLYETVMDATPIAAEDDQGSKSGGDPEFGLIPIQYFHDYQKAQVQLLLNAAPAAEYFTIPIVVFGAHPRATFNALYGTNIGVNTVASAEIIPGKKTAVLGANHPYVFYAAAQGFSTVGSGQFASPDAANKATAVMITDLVVARWQKLMADDPSRDPQAVLDECKKYWDPRDAARNAQISALVQHQGSLWYSDPNSLNFTFKVSLQQAAVGAKAEAKHA